ncbi:MAG: XRE family transcriptional regulator [Pseudomonadota bacterium]
MDTGETALDAAVGRALRELRDQNGLTARDLANRSGVSAAMISRIENGQVSPSLSTLASLAESLQTPLVSLFRETATATADLTHVVGGNGLKSIRTAGRHSHEYNVLGFHRRHALRFEAILVKLERSEESRPPLYNGHGCLFLYVLSGEALYQYGEHVLTLRAGDSLSFDMEVGHGFREVLTPELTFLSVQAETR